MDEVVRYWWRSEIFSKFLMSIQEYLYHYFSVSGQRSVPRTTTNYGDRSFAVSGPVVRNSLPAALRLDMSLSAFHRRLKTFFMTEATDSV